MTEPPRANREAGGERQHQQGTTHYVAVPVIVIPVTVYSPAALNV